MKMGLSLSHSQRMLIICNVCDEDSNDHAEWCPIPMIRGLVLSQRTFDCPDCGATGAIEVNADDYLECRKCQSLFSSSLSGRGEAYSEDKAKFVLIPRNSDSFDDCITVWRFEQSLGRGEFVIDRQIKLLSEMRDRILARKKQKQRKRKKKEKKNGARGSNR